MTLQILAERDWQCRTDVLKFSRLDQLSERDDLGVRIRDLDADGALPRNRRDDADALRAHCQREIVREIRDLPDLHASGGGNLELRHDRARRATDELALDAECAQRIHQL